MTTVDHQPVRTAVRTVPICLVLILAISLIGGVAGSPGAFQAAGDATTADVGPTEGPSGPAVALTNTEHGVFSSYHLHSSSDQVSSQDGFVEPSAVNGENVTLRLVPNVSTVPLESNVTFDVVVEDPNEGISAFDLEFQLEGTAPANFTDFTLTKGGDGFSTSNITDDGSTLIFEEGLTDDTYSPADSHTIGTATIRADDFGDVSIVPQEDGLIGDTDNLEYEITYISNSFDVADEEPSIDDVAITDTNEPVRGGDNATVEYTLTNTGPVAGTTEVTFSVDGEVIETANKTVPGEGTRTDTFQYDTARSDHPDIEATVEIYDSQDTETITVTEPAYFVVETLTATDPVVEGERIEATATINNTADVDETQEIELRTEPDIGSNTTSLSLEAHESDEISLSVTTESGDAGDPNLTIETYDDTNRTNVTVLEDAFFNATVTNVTEPVKEGETVTVEYTITNEGETSDTQDILLTVNESDGSFTIDEMSDVPLDPGESITENATYETGAGDAPGIEVNISSDDAADTRNVTVTKPPFFDVEITDTNDPVEGEDIVVDFTVSNLGDHEDNQTLTLTTDANDVAGEYNETYLQLEAGENTTDRLRLSTAEGDAGTYTVTLASENTSDSQSVTVLADAEYHVKIDEETSQLEPVVGEEAVVNYSVKNTGDVEDTQDISFAVDGVQEAVEADVTLGGGDTVVGNFTYETDDDMESIDVTVSSDDDYDTATVTVLDPAVFEVEIMDVDDAVAEGAEITVDYAINNTGDAEATQDIIFAVEGEEEAVEPDVTIDGGETYLDTFVYETTEGDAPSVNVTISSDDDSESATVTVKEEAIFAVTITDYDDTVVQGETVQIEYEIENTGDLEDTQDITFAVEGVEQAVETDVTLDGGETVADTFTYETSGKDVPSIDLTVSSEDNSTERTVTVLEPASFDVTIEDTNSPVVEGDVAVVEYTVTNVGDAEDTQDIVLAVDGVQLAGEEDVLLDGGESLTDQFTYETAAEDIPRVEANVSTDDDFETTSVDVLADAFFEVTIAETNAPVVEGETAHVDYNVTNVGDVAATQDIVFTVNDSQAHVETDVTLDGAETLEETVSYETDADDVPTITATVSSDNDSDTTDLTVLEDAYFDVTLTDVPDSVVEDEELVVEYQVSNTGDIGDEQQISVAINESPVGTMGPVMLDAGETTTDSFTYETNETDVPARIVTVASDNSSAETTVTVLERTDFEIQSVNATTGVIEGDPLSVDITLENSGAGEGTESVTLDGGPLGTASESVTLEPAAEMTTSLVLDTAVGQAGTHSLTVATDNDTVSQSVELVLPALPGHETPNRLDGSDGYVDVTGSDALEILDIQVLFEFLHTASIQDHAWAYDFAGIDAEHVTIFDVQALFNRYAEDSG